jgi:hypothetical protein
MAVMNAWRVLVRRNEPALAFCKGKKIDGARTLENPVR